MRTRKKNNPNPAVINAIQLAGGYTRNLAEALNCSQANIIHLLYRTVPPKRAIQIEEIFGIPREDLNPQIFLTNEKNRK